MDCATAEKLDNEFDKAEDSGLFLSNLIVAIADEVNLTAHAVEELGDVFGEADNLDANAMVKLQAIDRNAQILSNLARLLESVSLTIPFETKVEREVVQQSLLMSDLCYRLMATTEPTITDVDPVEAHDVTEAGESEYF
ncbi:hypothetical protein [Fulvimarina sp. MAC3]|uniref:hypothetical protein n=1 Tax=Fulvimarina sp. MAC3 TaxID=3148887 RepID=UPI0031FBB6EC